MHLPEEGHVVAETCSRHTLCTTHRHTRAFDGFHITAKHKDVSQALQHSFDEVQNV
jgi:hypothetical protein